MATEEIRHPQLAIRNLRVRNSQSALGICHSTMGLIGKPEAVMDGADSATVTLPADAMTTRVVRGSLWSLSGQGVMLLASLLATPFVIRWLGTEAYGVLTLVNLLIGYLAFADFGMGTASTRFGAEAHARGSDRDEAAVVWTSLLVSGIPSIMAALTLFILARILVEQALRLPPHLHEEAALALRIAAIGFVARTLANVLNTPQLVRLRMDLYASITTVVGVAQILLVPVVLFLGGGLVQAVIVVASMSGLMLVAHGVISQRLLPPMMRPRIRLAFIRPLTRFGVGLVFSSVAALILVNAEKLLLTRFASVKVLAHYSVASTVAGLLVMAPNALGQSLLPAFTRLHSSADHQALQNLYARALRWNLLWVAPAVVVLCVAARPFFTLWAGPEFGQASTGPFYILAFGFIFNVLAYVPAGLLLALGQTRLIARNYMAEVVPYVLCAAVLTFWVGAVGAAVAWSLRVIGDALLLFRAARRVSSLSVAPVLTNWRDYMLAVAVMALPLWLIKGSIATTTEQAIVSGVALIIYSLIVWKRVLTEAEQTWIKTKFSWRYPWLLGNEI